MHAFRILAGDGGTLILQPVIHAVADHRLERLADGGVGLEGQALGLAPARLLAHGQGISAGRFRPHLDPERGQFVQLERKLVERLRRTADQFQLDLGDRQRMTVRLDHAIVEGDLDLIRRVVAGLVAEKFGGAPDAAGKDRLQFIGQDQPDALAGLRIGQGVEIRLQGLDRSFPFAASQYAVAFILEGLDELPALLANAERQLAFVQAVVGGVVIDTLKPSGHGPPGFAGKRRRLPEGLQRRRIGRQFQFDLRLRSVRRIHHFLLLTPILLHFVAATIPWWKKRGYDL